MPIYEYSCSKCGAHLEVMQKISDKPLVRHPKCGGKLTKEWSRTGFQFKGSGWYVTDYAGRKSDGKDGSKEAAETKSESPASSESKTEATPAAEPKKSGGKESKGAKSSAASASGD